MKTYIEEKFDTLFSLFEYRESYGVDDAVKVFSTGDLEKDSLLLASKVSVLLDDNTFFQQYALEEIRSTLKHWTGKNLRIPSILS